MSSSDLPRTIDLLCSRVVTLLFASGALLSCGSTANAPKELRGFEQRTHVVQMWRATQGTAVAPTAGLTGTQDMVAWAAEPNVIALLHAATGREQWRVSLGQTAGDSIRSGVAYDGVRLALTTQGNQLVVLNTTAAGAEVAWRANLPLHSYTAPLLAGGRVFVLLADRSVLAFDQVSGNRLWSVMRKGEAGPLHLSHAITLATYKNTLLVGGAGSLLGLNPDNGEQVWALPVALSRATNDVERLNDLIGGTNRSGDSVCVRAYQTGLACLDLQRRQTTWSTRSSGRVGLGTDAEVVISLESDSTVRALERKTGKVLWVSEALQFRALSAPLVVGSSVVVGDYEGFVHVLRKTDGSFMARMATDGSAIAGAPVVAGQTVLVSTAKGGLFAYGAQGL